ncbi:ComF family protein [Nitrosophilus labii]|uniref:ComF family protein n=1 Tax=Nitrosophilus labii TaxID=2706014 RepID=UPI001656D07B|nr:ComF family protein [Nitrosophilus labii]
MKYICQKCQNALLKPTISKRELVKDFYVISFYKYKNIETLLKTKHTFIGSFVYEIVAKNSFCLFSKEFKQKAYVLPVDTRIKDYYSHTAILAKAMKSRYLAPLYNSLIAQNSVSYSAKSYQYRVENPRNFNYIGPQSVDVIIIDDIVTTGLTLKEAYEVVKQKANPLFALTLADARE